MKNYNLIFAILKVTVLLFLFSFSTNALAQTKEIIKEDRALVTEAVEDYVLGLYEVAPERIERSVDTSLHKIGYYDYDGEAYYHMPMTYQQLYDLSAKWNKDGSQANEESPKKIEIYEVHDRTASAKLTAKWGIDFMHLSKSASGKWKIMNIMWQAPPK